MRQDFFIDKEKAERCLSDIYQLYGLNIPTYTWVDDITNEKLLEILGTAGTAWTAEAAWAARASWTSGAARTSRTSRTSWASGASRASRASWASRTSRASNDYDFDYFLDVFDWLQKNPNKGNKNDEMFIKSMLLFLEAKENGAGYFAEFEGKGYIAPRCVIKLDEQYRHHSEIAPAIQWEKGLKLYFLHGIKLEKDLWEKIVNKTLPAQEAIALTNTEQRVLALQYLGGDKVIKELDGKTIFTEDHPIEGHRELIQIDSLKDVHGKPWLFHKGFDPAEGHEVYIRVQPDIKTCEEAMTFAYRLGLYKMTYQPMRRT